MRTELTLAELEEQDVELLPPRAALGYYGHKGCCNRWVSVYATNQALAMNVGSHFSNAVANANQNINVGG
jgi:hypothetical protein